MTQSIDQEQASMEYVTALFERLLRGEHFVMADMVLIDRMNENTDLPSSILAIVNITFHAKAKLPSRETYLRWAEVQLRHAWGDERAVKLLKNRR